MPRALILCAVLMANPLAVRADNPPKPGGPGLPGATGTETLIKMTVEPKAAPKPALRYQLLPEVKEMNPGNPIHAYLICFMEQNMLFHNKPTVDNREKWLACPLAELPLNEIRDYGGSASKNADYAARLDTPDWGVLIKLKRDGINLLLPEVQQLRSLAAVLKVRFRGEVADRRFDDAIRTAKTMFALSRHLSEHPTLIGNLVGIAIGTIATSPLEEMLQQPGCPNLYWALTDLPVPFIDLRKGMQGDKMFALALFAQFDDSKPMSDEQMKKTVDGIRELVKYLDGPGGPKGEVGAWLDQRAKDEAHVAAARKRLAEAGISQERSLRFPNLQVVLLDEKLDYEVRRDAVMKGMSLPYWQAYAVSGEANPGKDSGPFFGKEGESLLGQLIPAIIRIKRAQARLDQRLGLLRCIEAVRLYAADHGKPPAQLDDIQLPLPVDPFTGKAFRYSVDGMSAHLRGSPPTGEEKTPIYNLHYEVTIKK